MDINVESPGHDADQYGRYKKICEGQCKLTRLIEGPLQPFPGNATLIQYFQAGFQPGGEPNNQIPARINPQDIALIEEEVTHTFQDLNEISTKLAEAIRSFLRESFKNNNPDQDVVIGVCIPPSDKLVLTLFAIEKLGGAYLPFEVSFPEDRVIKITKDCRPVLIISDGHSNVLSKFDVVKDVTKVVSTTELFKKAEEIEVTEELMKKSFQYQSSSTGSDRTAIVLYTSGSSGEPKGVRISHRAIMNRLHWQWQTFPFEDNERCIFKTSLTFVDSVPEIFGPLLQGFSLTILPKQFTSNPSIFLQKLQQYKITRVVVVPSLLKAILQTIRLIGIDARNMLETVKLWVCSGETLTKDLVMEFLDYFIDGFTICNFYGSTEIMGDVTFVSFNSKEEVYLKGLEHHIPIGLPVNNTVIYILNEDDLEMTKQDEIGSIYVGGYNLAKGYVGTEEHPSFITNPYSKTPGFNILYKTGDYGRLTDTPGKIRTISYEGRMDSQIKVRGQRVDLSEVEMVMSGIDLVAKSKVLCYHPGEDDQAIVSFVVPAENVHFDRIKVLVETRLRDYERPVLRIVEDIPLLVNGKTDRQRLLKIYELDQASRTSFEADWNTLEIPDNKIEVAKIVLTTMSEITGTSVEDITDNLNNSFFNVGGSSLNSIQVIVKLRERKVFISIPGFVGANTIRDIVDIANLIKDEEEGEEESGLSVYNEAENIYDFNYLTDEDKDETCHIIAHSFAHHGDLEEYTDSTYDDFQKLIKSMWVPLVDKGFSFIVRRKDGDKKAIGVALNFDVYDEPTDVDLSKGIEYVLEMLEFIESRQREKLPKGKGKLVHSFMMGTPEDIDKSENVFVVQYMEEKVIKMAEEKKFMGVMTTNTNALTQQIASDIHGYEVLCDYQVNHYVAPDGKKPFMLAPDTFKIICCWKKVGGEHHLIPVDSGNNFNKEEAEETN